MMQLTITDAGRAALVNAANTGTLPITLDKVVLGSALYSPVATQTALQAPIKTITSFGADAVADDTIHITITDESADEYDLGEIGIYAGNTLFGIYSQSTPILEKGASQMVLLSADIQFTSVPVNSITVGATSFAYPQATETRMGVMKIATPAKVTEGTDHTSAVTPKTLKQEVSTRLGKTENAASASKWQTPRTVKLSGDATGEVTIDGSENVTLPVSVNDDSHNHSVLASKGNVTAVTGVARGAAGMMMMQSYANGYPEATGNVIHLGGLGQGEIFVGWSASSTTSVGYHAGLYVRSARDTNSLWSDWARVYTTAYKPTAADVGAMAEGGTYGTVWMNYWFRSIGATGWFNETYGGGINMEDATWVRVYGGKKFYVRNTEYDSILTDGGITAKGAIWASRHLGISTGNDYNTAPFEAQGNGSNLYPGYGFHQPGVFAGLLQMRTAADFYFLKQGGSALANVSANVFNGYLNGCAYAAERLATARTISISGDATGSAPFDGSGNISIPVTIAVSESIQPGMVFPTAQNSVPAGYLECNGAAVSRTTYAALYARLGTSWGVGDGSTTFNVPDLRGVFIRGLDNGRGLDVGRGFASYQADAFQGHGHFGVNVVGFTGGWGDQNSNIGTALAESAGTTDKGYGTPRIASETRPKNVAMRYCIKY